MSEIKSFYVKSESSFGSYTEWLELTEPDIEIIKKLYSENSGITQISNQLYLRRTYARIPNNEIWKVIRALERSEKDWPEIKMKRNQHILIRKIENEQKRKLREERKKYKIAFMRNDPYIPPKPAPEVIYEQTFKTDITGSDSLFCDTQFLEEFLKKKIKHSENCDNSEP